MQLLEIDRLIDWLSLCVSQHCSASASLLIAKLSLTASKRVMLPPQYWMFCRCETAGQRWQQVSVRVCEYKKISSHLQPSQVQISWTWSTVWWWAEHSQLAGSEPKALCGWRYNRDNWPGTRSWALSPWSGLKIPLEVPSGMSWCPCGTVTHERVCLFLFYLSHCVHFTVY